jgi:hypothetical protein
VVAGVIVLISAREAKVPARLDGCVRRWQFKL